MEKPVCCKRFAEFRELSKLVTSYGDYGDSKLDIEFNKNSNSLEVSTIETLDIFYFEFCPFCGKAIETE